MESNAEQRGIKMYYFNVDIACHVGVDCAIMFQNILHWIEKNIANEKNFYDNEYWTYNSVEAFSKLFPFWSRDKTRRILERLRDEGYVKTGNYNEHKYDKTLWYALDFNGKKYLSICQKPLANLPNGNGKVSQPIPDINTDVNQIDLYGASPEKESKPKRVTKVYGEFKNVKLTDDELKKLQDKWIDWKDKLEIFSTDKELHGYKYTNDYLALLKWRFNDVIPKQAEQKRPTFNDSIPLV